MELKKPANLTRSERIAVKLDRKLLIALKSSDQNALIRALQARTGDTFMRSLYQDDPQACCDYQLLGIQMQPALLLRENTV